MPCRKTRLPPPSVIACRVSIGQGRQQAVYTDSSREPPSVARRPSKIGRARARGRCAAGQATARCRRGTAAAVGAVRRTGDLLQPDGRTVASRPCRSPQSSDPPPRADAGATTTCRHRVPAHDRDRRPFAPDRDGLVQPLEFVCPWRANLANHNVATSFGCRSLAIVFVRPDDPL